MSNEDTPQIEVPSSLDDVETSLTREALYALVWSEPMLRVGERFGVSSSYMARVCTHMNVPRPDRGYWAKLAVGKAQDQIPLPAAQPGDVLVWSKGGGIHAPALKPKPPDRLKRVRVAQKLHTNQHPILTGAKELFESGGLSYEGGYLKPSKKLLVDLVVTKNGLDRVMSFTNQIGRAHV